MTCCPLPCRVSKIASRPFLTLQACRNVLPWSHGLERAFLFPPVAGRGQTTVVFLFCWVFWCFTQSAFLMRDLHCAAFGLYKLFSGIMDFVCIPAAAIGLRLSPHFNHPYFSASFGELWSKRWNLTAGTVLRNSIYDPIIEGKVLSHP